MKNLKIIFISILCASVLTACGCSPSENHKNTVSTEEPTQTEYVTERPDRNNNENNAGNAAGNIIDGAGNIVEDAGDAVNDAANDVGNAMRK